MRNELINKEENVIRPNNRSISNCPLNYQTEFWIDLISKNDLVKTFYFHTILDFIQLFSYSQKTIY